MSEYSPAKIEKRWQKYWRAKKMYFAHDTVADLENKMVLVEFPYPSGNLHMGHWYAFALPDMYARYQRMCGFNVMYPIGFDAFGLPAENAAIKRDIHPEKWTKENIAYMTGQMESMGAMFDWSRAVSTIDPGYYHWTQWMFLRMFEKDLAYRAKTTVNWCPTDKTVLANEQVVDGHCERDGTPVEQRELEQWMMRITKYADQLIDDIGGLDWPHTTRAAQQNWIGRSAGAIIRWKTDRGEIETFTTRPDTIYGVTFLVISPEKAKQWLDAGWDGPTSVREYVAQALGKRELERMEEKEKTGVSTGIHAVHPFSGEKVPIWVADYVLGSYGTGAIMAVPAHDERDYAFAQKFGLPVREVVVPNIIDRRNPPVNGKKSVERRHIHAIVRDPENGKYLGLKWRKFDWTTFPMGGIEEGEDVVAAARREVKEETGFTNLKLTRVIEGQVRAEYFAAHKDENRVAYTTAVMFDLIDHTQAGIDETEKNAHDIIWLDKQKLNYESMTHAEVDIWNRRMHGSSAVYVDAGVLVNSGPYSGLASEQAKQKIVGDFAAQKLGKAQTTYKLRDWVLSRQRYWGVPIPIIHCASCGYVPVPDKDLPVKLPPLKDFRPADDGRSPLAKATKWLNVKCPKCKEWAERETDTMDTFVDSSWYYLRYTDPKNKETFADKAKMAKWLPVPIYIGGAEHNTMHLLYSRFFAKALADLGYLDFDEPFTARRNHGIILGPDGQKMSKSKGNVVDPDAEVARYGADTVRMYLAFMAPYEQGGPWDPKGINGVARFLKRVWELGQQAFVQSHDLGFKKVLNRAVKKIGEDLEGLKFNTAVSELMKTMNAMEGGIGKEDFETFLKILAPLAPHITEELWQGVLKHKKSIHLESWPKYDPQLLIESLIQLPVQVNGRVRGIISVAPDAKEDDVVFAARAVEGVARHIEGRQIRKVIYIPGKTLNIVINE